MGSLLKDELDLNDLFRPLTFLNSLCQLTARQAHCPMDVLNLVSAWSKSSIVSPTLVIIKSLITQGAEMNGTQLKETSRDAPEIVPLPPLLIELTQKGLIKQVVQHHAQQIYTRNVVEGETPE